jgi:hypothetical protein
MAYQAHEIWVTLFRVLLRHLHVVLGALRLNLAILDY